MRAFTLPFFAFFLFSISGNADESASIIGKWQMIDVDGKKPGVPVVFEFGDEGKVTKHLGNRAKMGAYTLSEDRKTLTIESGGKKSPSKVVLLDDTTLKLQDSGKLITLSKALAEEKGAETDPEKKEPTELSIVGSWKMVGFGKKELTDKVKSSVFVFEEDGNFIRRRGTSVRRGKYKLSEKWEEEKTLTLTPLDSRSEDKGDAFKIVTFTQTELVLDEGDFEISLSRISGN